MTTVRFGTRPAALLALATVWSAEQAAAQSPAYNLAIRFIGEYPSNTEPFFSSDIQGVATDGSHWYVTQTGDLWKFPITMNWDDVIEADPQVIHTELDDYVEGAPFVHPDFIHMGDLECHNACGQNLLIIPLHGDGPESPYTSGLLVLRASDLGPIGWWNFPGLTAAACCAVDPTGDIWIPGSGFDQLACVRLDCAALQLDNVVFTPRPGAALLDDSGAPLARHHKQGSVYSPDGRWFVLSTGYKDAVHSHPVDDGIHVFDTTTWRRVAHSTNGAGLFSFLWSTADEEPEGMAWIDLDGAGVPGMDGQLHILLLNNDDPNADNVFLKHYTHRIWVDGSAQAPFCCAGTLPLPYQTVADAVALAWSGSEIRIRTGIYLENLTIAAQTRIVAHDGLVRIGSE